MWWGQAALPAEIDRPTYEAKQQSEFRLFCPNGTDRTLETTIHLSGPPLLARSRCVRQC